MRPDDHDPRLLAAQVRLIWDQVPQTLIGALACVDALVIMIVNTASPQILLVWTLSMVAALAVQYVGYLRFRRLEPAGPDLLSWRNAFTAALLLNGLLWGAGAVLLLPAGSIALQVFLAFLLGIISTGAIATLAAIRFAGHRFFLPAMLPYIATMFYLGSPEQVAIGSMMLLQVVLLWVFAGTMHRAVTASLRLQLENTELVAFLEKSEASLREDVLRRAEAERRLTEARKAENSTAERIQQMLLFGPTPRSLNGAALSVQVITASHVSGDFYDIYRHGEYCFDILVGDVMGKGIPAALIGAAAKSRFLRALSQMPRTAAGGPPPEPVEIVRFAHGRFTNQLAALESFVTVLFARFDLAVNRLTWVNCGHTNGIHYVRPDGVCTLLPSRHPPLGFDPDEVYEQETAELHDGDVVFLYSDGITEARSPEGEQFGLDRLIELIADRAGESPASLVEDIKDALAAFTQTHHFPDDLTCVAVRIETEVESGGVHVFETTGRLAELPEIRGFVRRIGGSVLTPPLAPDALNELAVAVTEVASNIMRHAYQGEGERTIRTEVRATDQEVTVRFMHYGFGLRPGLARPGLPETPEAGGRGLFLIERTVDAVSYFTEEDGASGIMLTKKRGD